MMKLSIINFAAAILLLFISVVTAPLRLSPQARRAGSYYCKKGEVQYDAEMYTYAIFNLEKCLELEPGHYRAANLLALIMEKRSEMLQAIDYYKKSLGINNRQPNIHYRIGELYESFLEMDLAFGHYKKSVSIDPNHIKSNLALVRHYLKKKDRASAERNFNVSERQGRLKSGDSLAKAAAAEESENYKQAIELYKKVVEESPSVISAYMRLAELHRMRGDYASAVKILEKLKYVRPDIERVYVLLGNIYFNRRIPGRRDFHIRQAIKNFKKALEINPDNPETYYALSGIYSSLGKKPKAEELERKARLIEKRVEGR
jgi:tetratricopeptide (TPR) repeat protein